MEKLSKINATFDQNSLKIILTKLQKGARAAVLGTAIASASILGTGCPQPVGGNPGIEKPEETTDSEKFGGEPYDQVIGNGNYSLHTFSGKNIDYSKDTIINVTNHYLNKANDYVKGLTDKLSGSSTQSRSINYFDNLVNKVNGIYFRLDSLNPNMSFDRQLNLLDSTLQPYFKDIVYNLDEAYQRDSFHDCYRVLANESFKAGLGPNMETTQEMRKYRDEKNFLVKLGSTNNYFKARGVDINQEYEQNNFHGITNILDELLALVADNMNSRYNYNVTVEQLQQIIKLGMSTESLYAFHENTKGNLNYKNGTLCLGLNCAIDNAITEKRVEERQQRGL
ncbi:MAG: hypothetical protein MJ054_01210 [Clostridia bacterium]|nr:hypothetical protein [Clostridia bacterium]